MSISCKCLNIVVKLVESDTESLRRFDLETYLSQKRQQQQHYPQESATKATTPSDDHFLFFKEALGPVRCATVIQFDGLLRKVRVFEEWDLCQCRNCECTVYAQKTNESTSASNVSCLVNATLMTTQEQLSAREADENYSPAFGILLNGSSLSYSDLVDKSKLLSKAKSDNQFVQLLRAYMERETEAANERIHRFTEQQFAVLKVKRERAEQDCLILAKLANNVPELLHNISSSSNTSEATIQPITTAGSTERVTILRGSVSPMVATGTSDSNAGSQLETPPPTPEYMPMSTGNSPPMITAASANTRQQVNVAAAASSTSSSASTADQSSSPSPGARLNASARVQNRANFSSFNSNNNNNVSFSNTHGAISRQPLTVMMMQQTPTITTIDASTAAQQQHSSTNSSIMQQQQRLLDSNSFESDCMFDIDGMENDKSPLSNTLSDEEELGFDDSIGNNNDDGIYIPSRQLGRQNSSIAKSLPISMPQVMTQFRTNEEDFEEMTEDNVDIAASIKALARSVHGDTVFGDLPRPQIQRFSTQI
ncbi:uncharacterized protein LOC131688937 [Topomyia yanbarensis]|uniref:uncharacterized protein LOC131688937 n=1 Tax=Topomyia yanbarensis TaxID=2498891 RepID=UPI00273AAF94|nr:uncharacterized protein LOC131688937 [Topomyia yanbarensis]